jgi:hypothetical protein
LEAIHLPPAPLLAIVREKKMRSRWGMDALKVEARSNGRKGCEIHSHHPWSL